MLQLSAAEYVVDETSTTVSFEVTRTGGSNGMVTVDITTSDGSATAGADYRATTTTATFNDGETGSKIGTVGIFDDNDDEPDETIVLTLSSVTGGATVGAQGTATVRIVDDDPALRVLMGTASGVAGSGLVVRNNNGADIPIVSDGTFTVSPSIAEGESYAIEVTTQPWGPAQTCTVTNGSGTIGAADVTDVQVDCVAAQLQTMVVERYVDAEDRWDLYLVDEDGGNLLQLAGSLDDERFLDVWQDWIIVMRDAGSGRDIYAVRQDGTQLTPLATAPEDENYRGITDSGSLVFVRSGDLFAVNIDGSGLLQLTNASETDSVDRVTPDGRIVFSRRVFFQSDLYAIDVDGGNLTPLAVAAEDESFMALTPGGRIVYFRVDGAQTKLWSVMQDGTAAVELANDPAASELLIAVLDNERLVVQRDAGGGQYDLLAVDSDGANLAVLASTAGREDFVAAVPGERIVYSLDAGGQNDLYVVNLDGSNRIPLAVAPTLEIFSGVLPDGRGVFQRGDNGQEDIYTIELDGTNEVQLTATPESEFIQKIKCFECTSIPGARNGRILFQREVGGQVDLFSMRLDGTDERQLTSTPEDELVFEVSAIGGVIHRSANSSLGRVGLDGNGIVPIAPSTDSESFKRFLD
ncbi:MAG: Calx-beta domain-containing protein [Pseudomonadota bacterium]